MTESMAELLAQDKIWQQKTPDGLQTIRIEDMTPGHLYHLEAWLLRNSQTIQATALYQVAGMAEHIQGEQAAWDVHFALAEENQQHPLTWMREQPLFQAIGRRMEQLAREAS